MNCVACAFVSAGACLFFICRFRGQIHLHHVGLLANVHHRANLFVFRLAIAAHDDAQIRIIHAQVEEFVVQAGEVDGRLVDPDLPVGLDADVIGFARRVFRMARGVGKLQVKIVDDGCGGNDEDD